MYFLNKIDELYLKERIKHHIPETNKEFQLIVPIEQMDFNSDTKFLVKKGNKAKIYIQCGKQRIHLTDLQIIDTILAMSSDQIQWFLDQFVNAYNERLHKIKFIMNQDEFSGWGIEYPVNSKPITLFSDSTININDFIFVINFILSKDIEWGEISKNKDFRKTTLIKYITLIDYYGFHSERSKIYLEKIGYETSRSYPREASLKPISGSTKRKSIFENYKAFDISLYA